MTRNTIRPLIALSVILGGCSDRMSETPHRTTVEVEAPRKNPRVDVEAPGVSVKVDKDGTRVKTPGVDVKAKKNRD